MIDMFGGSGGFTTGYINYLNNKYDIDWKDNINKIYHFDMNEDVVKSAGLEFFCLTGVLPNMKDNLSYRNSFTDEFNNKKFMNVITNPPYGGDKVVQSDAQIKRKKIKEYIKKELVTLKDEVVTNIRLKQLKKIEDQEKQDKKDSDKTKVSVEMCSNRIIKYAKNNKLTGNDKESSSLILIMDLVDINGTAIGVLKEGVFFNKTYKDIRKCLVENFNVSEIISVPQDQFENTLTKTSIVVFHNTKEKTTTVKFSELIVERYTEDKFEEINGEIVLTENKDDICGISDKLISQATKDEILKNPICSLNGKDYNKKVIVVGKGYESHKINNICKLKNGFAFKPDDYKTSGIPLISIKHIPNFIITDCHHITENIKYDNFIIKENDILIALSGNTIGKFGLYLNKQKSYCNQRVAQIRIEDKIMNRYIYYIFEAINFQQFIINISNNSAQPNVSSIQIEELQIPIPKSKQKITEWVDKISKPYDKKNKNQELIIKLEEEIKSIYKDIEDNEDCNNVKLEEILIRKNNGRTNTNDVTNTGIYPFYSATAGNPSGTHNTFDFDGEYYLLFAKSGGSSKTIFGNTLGIGKFWLVTGKSSGNVAMIKFEINKDFNIKYIYYYLKYKLFEIQKLALYSTGNGNIQVEDMLKTFKLKIPKNKKLIKDFEPLFEKIEKLQIEMKEAEALYKKLINELSEEAIPSNKQIEIKSDNEINELSEESHVKEPIIETSEKKSKITKNKSKTNSSVI